MHSLRRSAVYRQASLGCVSLALFSLATAMPAQADVANSVDSPRASVRQDSKPHLKLRIAVDQSKWEEIRNDYWDSAPHNVREGIQALLVEKLIQSGHFQVMERESTARQAFNEENKIDENKRRGSASAAAVPVRARTTPAKYIITPTLTDFQVTSNGGNGINLPGFPGRVRIGSKKQEVSIGLNIRISDAETSALLDSVTAHGKQVSKSKSVSLDFGPAQFDKQKFTASPMGLAVEEAFSEAVDKIVKRLDQEPWSALVADYDEGTGHVILNVGSDSGIAVGQQFFVNRTGKKIIDPDTGDIISRGDETRIGRIRVVRVEPGVAFADVVSGKGFRSGNMIRIAD